METSEENGAPFDMNEDKDGGTALQPCYSMKERSVPRLLGVVAAPEAGKVHIYVTGIGRNVNNDAAVQPPSHGEERIWGLTQKCLPAQFTSGCVISGVCGDLNGFTESFGDEEGTMVSLDGGGVEGATCASCPAVLLGPLSTETHRHTQVNETDPLDSDLTSAPSESANRVALADCVSTSAPPDRRTCAVKQQRSGSRITTAFSCPDVNMLNGASDLAHSDQTGVFSSPATVEAEIVNCGFHSSRAACDCSVHNDTSVDPEERAGWASSLSNQSGTTACLCPVMKRSGSEGDPEHSAAASEESRDRPASEPSFRENEVNFSPRTFRVRPNSLRTNPNLTVSLSCDATPLSPEENSFYFGDEGYSEDFRNVQDPGRRQSAPDQMPDLSGTEGCSESQVMPKRFGIADFFTRYVCVCALTQTRVVIGSVTGGPTCSTVLTCVIVFLGHAGSQRAAATIEIHRYCCTNINVHFFHGNIFK